VNAPPPRVADIGRSSTASGIVRYVRTGSAGDALAARPASLPPRFQSIIAKTGCVVQERDDA
jgi:hypothetical protein